MACQRHQRTLAGSPTRTLNSNSKYDSINQPQCSLTEEGGSRPSIRVTYKESNQKLGLNFMSRRREDSGIVNAEWFT
jgi:hypothetical protein